MAKFMAVQCFNCSTMQVKQQKKSSNKWTCAVCNEKQSVRKVYATSLMAKDVRRFVQSFNMSRKSADDDHDLHGEYLTVATEDVPAPFSSKRKSTATDWTAYLDAPEPHEIQEETESAAMEMFKKPRLGPADDLKGKGLHKPSFSKRHATATASYAATKSSSFQGVPKSDGGGRRRGKSGRIVVRDDSKWSAYVTDDEDHAAGDGCFSSAAGLSNFHNTTPHDAFSITADHGHQQFEEDMHPDFK